MGQFFMHTRRWPMLRKTVNTGSVWLVTLALLGFCGCQSDTIPVSGKVSFKNGQPVTAGFVIFEPVNQKVGARGEIQPDGTFQLGTHADKDGAMEGEYKVLIAPPPLPEEGKPRPSAIHPKYRAPESTPLKFTVTRDRVKNKFNIELE